MEEQTVPRQSFLRGKVRPLKWHTRHKSYEEMQDALEQLSPRMTYWQLREDYPECLLRKSKRSSTSTMRGRCNGTVTRYQHKEKRID